MHPPHLLPASTATMTEWAHALELVPPALAFALTLVVGALLAPVPVAAQSGGAGGGVISGLVTDDAGAPLPRVHVWVAGSERRAVTGEGGEFVLRGVRPGRQRVEASLAGYATVMVEVEVVRAEEARVRLLLAATPLVLPGLVVTGAATGGAALDLTRSASQLSGRALERRLGSSVAETLSGEPGLAVRYNGPGAAAPVVRGLTGDRVVVMQDGHRSADLAGSAEDHVVTIDPLSAQRIEVVRGPAALLYGNNALGGVVNVLTGGVPVQGVIRPEVTAAVQVQSAYPGATMHARGAVPVGERGSVALRLSGRRTDDVRIGRDPGVPGAWGNRLPDSWLRQGSGGLSVGYAGSRVTGGAALSAFGFRYGLPMPPEEESAIHLEGRLLSATGRLEVELGGQLFPALRLAGSASDYAHDELEDGDLEMAFGLRTRIVDVQLRQAARGPLDEGVWGASVHARDYVAAGADQLTPPARARAVGVFTYQRLPLATGAALELGLRLDRHGIASSDDAVFGPGTSRSFLALSGSLGTSVTLAPGVTAALSAARSYRAPTVEELFSDALHAGTASYEIGDPGLRPETMSGLDAVLRLRHERVAGELSAYVSRIDDFVTLAARGDTLLDGVVWPVLAYTQERARMRGAEAAIDWRVRDAVVLGARGDVVRGELAGGGPVPFLPPARLGASLRWEPAPWSLGGELTHAWARRESSGGSDVPTDAYTLVSLDAGLWLMRGQRSHSVTLRVGNVMDRAYRDAASRIKRFAPNPGRDVSLLYRVHF